MNRYTLLFLIAIAAFAFSGCQPAQPVESGGTGSGTQAWMDAPLPGSVYPPGTVPFVAHGSSPAGVAMLEFSLQGGGTLGTWSSQGANEKLATANFEWNVSEPGTYTVLVRALDNEGNWSGYAATTVIIDSGAPPFMVVMPGTGTPRPTATPTRPAGGSGGGISFENVSVNPAQIYFIGTNCGPTQATVTVHITGANVASARIIYHAANSASWSYGGMDAQGGGWYSFIISGGSIPGEDPDPGLGGLPVSFYFQALNSSGQSLEFSQVYGGLTDTFCNP